MPALPSGSSRMTDSAVIDLPEPDSPTSPMTSPASIDRSMSLRIGVPPMSSDRFSISSRLIADA